MRPEPKKNVSKQPTNIAKRFYYDTILHSAPVLEFMIGHVGADRVMLGSDYPYDMGMMDCVKHVRSLKISDADKATILARAPKLCYRGKHERSGRQSRPNSNCGRHKPDRRCDEQGRRTEDDAVKIAELMLEADLIGADAHGVFRLMQYVQRLKLGSTNPRPNITVNRTAPATALVDGDNGMGHLVVARAAETAIELARECGVAWVGCRMSGHAGAAGVYAALPLKADMVGLYSAVANANHMPLAGGAEPLLGTNPLAIAIPAGKETPVVLDIATSIVSYGTIKNHRLQNKPLQDDWMIDPKTGEAVIDPHKSAEALLLPMAGYKGAGLALTLGLLAGTLNGALFGRDCVDFNAEPDKVTNTGQFVVALDPSPFPAARPIQGRGRSAYPRTAQHESATRPKRSPAGRAARAASRRPPAQRTHRSRQNCWRSSTSSQASLAIKPLRERG